MSDLEELGNDRLNELESYLYASVHFQDNNESTDHCASVATQSVEAPKPLGRFVSATCVINKSVTRPGVRYWKTDTKPEITTKITAAASTKPLESTNIAKKSDNEEAPLPNTLETIAKEQNSFDVVSTTTSKEIQDKTVEDVIKSMPPPPAKVRTPNSKKKQLAARKYTNTATTSNRPNTNRHFHPRLLKKEPEQQEVQKFKSQQISGSTCDLNRCDEPKGINKKLLKIIPIDPPHRESKSQSISSGPRGRVNRKIEQLQRLSQKTQKSKQARINKKLYDQKQQPAVLFIDLAEDDDENKGEVNADDDEDDVILVPMSPPKVIDLDDDSESNSQPYIEENAMDAADVKLNIVSEGNAETVNSLPNSPGSSVMSSDDFIVQKDSSRVMTDNARATDEDLLVLTQHVMELNNKVIETAHVKSPVEEPTADDSSEYEFVPPSILEEIKQNYRVDEQQYRALDVYETESDLAESGVYSKSKVKPTIIRHIESQSDSTDVEEIVATTVNKTKRLRKRRSSSANQSQSEPNDEDKTDSDDGVHTTGVPGLSRGMAVERCKRKIRRLSGRQSTETRISTDEKKANNKQTAATSESNGEEDLPTARDIAERLLKNKHTKMRVSSGEYQENSINPNAYIEDDDAVSIGSSPSSDNINAHKEACESLSTAFKLVDTCSSQSQSSHNRNNEADKEVIEEIKDGDENITPNSDDEVQEVIKLKAESNENINYDATQVLSKLEEKIVPRGCDLLGWNYEMCRFYNSTWHGENFSLNKVLSSMTPLKQEWKINNADRYPIMRPRSKMKCINCLEMGHVRLKCPRPRKPAICNMCGVIGHAEPRCPNAICLGCGSKQAFYVRKCKQCHIHTRIMCQLCKLRGHTHDLCPDKWRRYHSTTRPNVELDSNVQFKPKICSYCGTRGHFFENCRQRIGDYRNTNFSTNIISYQKTYEDSAASDIPQNHKSFFSLEADFYFNWTLPVENSYYGRFLKEVGLKSLINRKRKPTNDLTTEQILSQSAYVPNPLVAAAYAAMQRISSVIPEKPTTVKQAAIVQSTAEETSLQRAQTTKNIGLENQINENNNSKLTKNIRTTVKSNKPTDDIATSIAASITPITVNKPPALSTHDFDSDSNYSFSEHFEVPVSTSSIRKAVETTSGTRKPRPMESLPDIIPLQSNDNENGSRVCTDNFNCVNMGISMCLNKNNTNILPNDNYLAEVPSEAKIFMARDQINDLMSPEGSLFLTNSAKQCNVEVRMDFKRYGHVLVVHGMKKNQEDLQIILLRRNKDMKIKSLEFQSQKPPKRVDVLIRFLRDGINTLNGNLGNAIGHYKRINELHQMNTKNSFKSIERKRRTLNMILLGQAGLLNGDMHLTQLLIILKDLVENKSPEENASNELRNEIEEHWRMIFTAYPHSDYETMLHDYSKLALKNRLPQLGIDPVLLGLQERKKVERPSIPAPPPAPSIKLNIPDSSTIPQKNASAPKARMPPVPRPPSQRNLPNPMGQAKQLHQQPSLPLAGKRDPTVMKALPFNNPQYRPMTKLRMSTELKPECEKLLMEINTDTKNTVNADAFKPSMFWSRESFKYLDKLFKMNLDANMLERFKRVLQRSKRGELSHNDYRAVIKLYTLLQNK